MIAFSHFTIINDISGVSTWLRNLLIFLREAGEPVALQLHHYGQQDTFDEAVRPWRELDIDIHARLRPATTRGQVDSVLAFLQEVRPTLFAPQTITDGFFAARIAGRAGLPWLLTIHSDDEHYWKITEAVRPEQNGGGLVAVSEYIRSKLLRDHLATQPTTIPYGVALPDLPERPASPGKHDSAPFRVVFLGRIAEHQKRISLVVRTLIEACQLNSAIEARLIGDGPDASATQNTVKQSRLGQRISFTGRLDANGVARELDQAHAILFMSDFEGLPVALMEAMAHGVVPVARAIPSGIPELVHHDKTGLLVGDDPQQAARAICNLAADHARCALMAAESRALIERSYSQAACHRHWLELIQSRRLTARQAANLSIPATGSIPPLLYRFAKLRRCWQMLTSPFRRG